MRALYVSELTVSDCITLSCVYYMCSSIGQYSSTAHTFSANMLVLTEDHY
jgi:hypothetical protein